MHAYQSIFLYFQCFLIICAMHAYQSWYISVISGKLSATSAMVNVFLKVGQLNKSLIMFMQPSAGSVISCSWSTCLREWSQSTCWKQEATSHQLYNISHECFLLKVGQLNNSLLLFIQPSVASVISCSWSTCLREWHQSTCSKQEATSHQLYPWLSLFGCQSMYDTRVLCKSVSCGIFCVYCSSCSCVMHVCSPNSKNESIAYLSLYTNLTNPEHIFLSRFDICNCFML